MRRFNIDKRCRKIGRYQYEVIEWQYEGTLAGIAEAINDQQAELAVDGWSLESNTMDGMGRRVRATVRFVRPSDAIGQHIEALDRQPERHLRLGPAGYFDMETGQPPTGMGERIVDTWDAVASSKL